MFSIFCLWMECSNVFFVLPVHTVFACFLFCLQKEYLHVFYVLPVDGICMFSPFCLQMEYVCFLCFACRWNMCMFSVFCLWMEYLHALCFACIWNIFIFSLFCLQMEHLLYVLPADGIFACSLCFACGWNICMFSMFCLRMEYLHAMFCPWMKYLLVLCVLPADRIFAFLYVVPAGGIFACSLCFACGWNNCMFSMFCLWVEYWHVLYVLKPTQAFTSGPIQYRLQRAMITLSVSCPANGALIHFYPPSTEYDCVKQNDTTLPWWSSFMKMTKLYSHLICCKA